MGTEQSDISARTTPTIPPPNLRERGVSISAETVQRHAVVSSIGCSAGIFAAGECAECVGNQDSRPRNQPGNEASFSNRRENRLTKLVMLTLRCSLLGSRPRSSRFYRNQPNPTRHRIRLVVRTGWSTHRAARNMRRSLGWKTHRFKTIHISGERPFPDIAASSHCSSPTDAPGRGGWIRRYRLTGACRRC